MSPGKNKDDYKARCINNAILKLKELEDVNNA